MDAELCNEGWENPENHIGYLLKSLMHGLRQSTEAALREAGLELSMAHLVTLSSMRREPGLPGAQLAKRLSITAQSMNALLKQVENDGYAQRQPHPGNLRAHRWFLTDTGREVLEQALAVCAPVLARTQSLLDESERRQLTDLLRRCIAGLHGQPGLADGGTFQEASKHEEFE